MTERELVPASIGARGMAAAIDAVTFGVPVALALVPVLRVLDNFDEGVSVPTLAAAFGLYTVWLVIAIGGLAIYASMKSHPRGTWGMRFAGTRLVDVETHQEIGLWPAMLRQILAILAALSVIGLLAMLLDKKRRGWHDHAVGSAVTTQEIARDVKRPRPKKKAEAETPTVVSEVPGGVDKDAEPESNVEKPRIDALDEIPEIGDENDVEVPSFVKAEATQTITDDQPAADAPVAAHTNQKEAPAEPAPVTAEHELASETIMVSDRQPTPGDDIASETIMVADRQATDVDEEAFKTQIARPQASSNAAMLVWDDGTVSTVEGTGVFGRSPVAGDIPNPVLFPISDETRSLSKTHFVVMVKDESIIVVDRHSTNGTEIIDDKGASREAFPGTEIPVFVGERIVIAERSATIGRAG